jgi:hypothetical protein
VFASVIAAGAASALPAFPAPPVELDAETMQSRGVRHADRRTG